MKTFFTAEAVSEAGGSDQKNQINYYAPLEIKGDWNMVKGRLRQKWASLTEDDLQYAEGQQEEMLGRIQKRTGASREAIEKVIHGACPTYGF